MQQDPPHREGLAALSADAPRTPLGVQRLLRGGGREDLAPRRFLLWLWLGRLLDFFSAFVFTSHGCKCATNSGPSARAR
jgi:hypothetical protein